VLIHYWGADNDIIDGGADADSLIGGAGADSIGGDAGNDVIDGGTGADTILGGAGSDTITAGAGDTDVIQYATVTESNTSSADTITDFVSGTDKLNITLNYGSVLGDGNVYNAVVLNTGTGYAGLTAAQAALSSLRGETLYDTTNSALYVNVDNNNLITSLDYQINVTAASTVGATVQDGDINFILTTGTGADSIVAGSGADTITAGEGNDTINAGSGNDSIVAGSGADNITGGLGADTITGGTQTDTYVFAAGSSSSTAMDVITDYATTEVIDHATLTITRQSSVVTAAAGVAGFAGGGAAATFDSGDTTLASRIIAVEAGLASSTHTAGEAGHFMVGSDTYIFITDGVAGVGANDVIIRLVGVDATDTAFDVLSVSGGNASLG